MDRSHQLEELFNRCFAQQTEHPHRHFRVGPTPFSCKYLGNFDISFFTNALAHLEEAEADKSAFDICVIDAKTTSFSIPNWLWQWPSVNSYNGEMQGLPEGFYGNCNTQTYTLIIIDFVKKKVLFWAEDIASYPKYERGFPLRKVMVCLHSSTNFVLVHGGAVGFASGGVLLAGIGGSGKSTATMACLHSPLYYAGDDFVLADTENAYIHSMFNVAKLEEHNFVRFPQLVPHIYNRHEMPGEKGQLFLHQFMPEKLIKGFPLKAILLPKFTGEAKTRFRRATSAEAMLSLAPSSTLLLQTSTTQVMQIAKLVRALPAFWLETGTEMPDIPLTIEKLLNEALPA